MTVDKVIAKIIWLTFFGPPCICSQRAAAPHAAALSAPGKHAAAHVLNSV